MSAASLQALLASTSGPPAVRSAAIEADLLENTFTERPLTLAHHIEIVLEPGDATLRLGPLALGVRSWEELAGTVWRPGPPQRRTVEGRQVVSGRAQGHLVVGDAQREVACASISFGTLEGDRLPARLDLVVDEPAGRRWLLDAALEIGPIRVLGDVVTKPRPDLPAALALAADHLDLTRLQAAVEDGIVVLRRP